MRLNYRNQRTETRRVNPTSATTRSFFVSFVLLTAPIISGCEEHQRTTEDGGVPTETGASNVGFNSSDSWERMRAVRKVDDTYVLANWANLAEHSDVRLACIEKFLQSGNLDEVLRVFSGTLFEDTRTAITTKLTEMVDEMRIEYESERNVLVHVACYSEDEVARYKAVYKLEGQIEELANIAALANDKRTAEDALRLIPEYSEVKEEYDAKLNKLADALERVALSPSNEDVRMHAVFKLVGNLDKLSNIREHAHNQRVEQSVDGLLR